MRLSICYDETIVQIMDGLILYSYSEWLLFKIIGENMSHSLRKYFFMVTVAVSLAVVTSPSYAKDESDKKPKTSKVKKATKDKAKKETSKKKSVKKQGEKKGKPTRSGASKKDSDSSKGSKRSGGKSAKSDEESGRGDSKGSDNAKGKGDKDGKSSQSDESGSSSNKSAKNKGKSSSRSGTTTSKAKKQYKNIIVNLNKADAKTFSHYLMGIGEKRAKAIVAHRKKNGKFKDIKDLLEVEGIGDKIFDGLKKNVSLSKGEISAPKGDKSKSGKTK